MRDGLMLLGTLLCSFVGFAWLALAMEAHWRQSVAAAPAHRGTVLTLRAAGTSSLVFSFWLCLQVNHVSMAALVCVMSWAAAALAVAFTLTWRPRWLALLVGCARRED